MSDQDTIVVEVRGLSGNVSLEVPAGSTVAEVRSMADEINEGAVIRIAGEAVTDEDAVVVQHGQTLIVAPPAAKHG